MMRKEKKRKITVVFFDGEKKRKEVRTISKGC